MERLRNWKLMVGLVALLVLGSAVIFGGCAPADEVEEMEEVDEEVEEMEEEEEEMEEEEEEMDEEEEEED